MIENEFLRLDVDAASLTVTNKRTNNQPHLEWPCVAVHAGGDVLCPETYDDVQEGNGTVELTAYCGPLELTTTITLRPGEHWFRIAHELHTSDAAPATPDWVTLFRQPQMPVDPVGYHVQHAYRMVADSADQEGEETGAGQVPGCGYPVYAADAFLGVEHPAAFTLQCDEGVECRHHPAWSDDGVIACPPVVYGVPRDDESVEAAFLAYLEAIRLPRRTRPLVAAVTFWTDPYRGDYEYQVSADGYRRFANEWLEAGYTPDMVLLDAGWGDRKSVLGAKEVVGGDAGLVELKDTFAQHGIQLGLWMSFNGPMGIDPDWAEAQGYAVGGGPAAAYTQGKYVVLLDRRFEADLTARMCELVQKADVRFLKFDWDNDCAANDSFRATFPTPNHVREASTDATIRLFAALRAAKPDMGFRYGWWPSPWWLMHASHLWLTESGDCEGVALPSLTQRDRVTTHRDAMYYQHLVAQRTPVPLDVIDNHELPKGPRNPFDDPPDAWANNAIMLALRGTTYIPFCICPESLTTAQATVLRRAFEFMNAHAHILAHGTSTMVGGNPALGQVYGYLHTTPTEALLVLRNPSVEPVTHTPDLASRLPFAPRSAVLVYPCLKALDPTAPSVDLLCHGVAVVYLSKEEVALEAPVADVPFVLDETDGAWLASIPSGEEAGDAFGTEAPPFNRYGALALEQKTEKREGGRTVVNAELRVSLRCEQPRLLVKVSAADDVLDRIRVTVGQSRYFGSAAGHAVPVTRIFRKNGLGHGLSRNMKPEPTRGCDYYMAPLTCGGDVKFVLGVDAQPDDAYTLDVFAMVYRGRSRKAVAYSPPAFLKALLPAHPLGFGEYLKIV